MWSACHKTWNNAIKIFKNIITGTVSPIINVMEGYFQWNYKTSLHEVSQFDRKEKVDLWEWNGKKGERIKGDRKRRWKEGTEEGSEGETKGKMEERMEKIKAGWREGIWNEGK